MNQSPESQMQHDKQQINTAPGRRSRSHGRRSPCRPHPGCRQTARCLAGGPVTHLAFCLTCSWSLRKCKPVIRSKRISTSTQPGRVCGRQTPRQQPQEVALVKPQSPTRNDFKAAVSCAASIAAAHSNLMTQRPLEMK